MAAPWRKLWTQASDNVFLMHDNNAWIVFTKLILLVNDSGQYTNSVREMTDLMALNYKTLYSALVRLEDHGIIKMIAKPRGRYTTISLTNWHIYQPASTPVGRQIRRQSDRQSQQIGNAIQQAEPQAVTQAGGRQTAGSQTKLTEVKNATRIKNKDSSKKQPLDDLISQCPNLQPELSEYVAWRVKAKLPMSEQILMRILGKLEAWYPNDPKLQKACLEKALINGWRDVYKLKDDELPVGSKPPVKRSYF